MPKVLIDFGPVIDAGPVPELMTAAAAIAPAEIPPPAVLETPPAPAAVIEPVAPPMDATTPAEDTAGVPDQRLAGIRSAEIDTGSGAVPAPELLATPASGPSIMLDPNLVAEMDAFELANTAATPPPTVTAAPPAKPAAAPAAPAVPGAVVSFVKGGGHPAPVAAPVGGPTLNNAPTVPIVTGGRTRGAPGRGQQARVGRPHPASTIADSHSRRSRGRTPRFRRVQRARGRLLCPGVRPVPAGADRELRRPGPQHPRTPPPQLARRA